MKYTPFLLFPSTCSNVLEILKELLANKFGGKFTRIVGFGWVWCSFLWVSSIKGEEFVTWKCYIDILPRIASYIGYTSLDFRDLRGKNGPPTLQKVIHKINNICLN